MLHSAAAYATPSASPHRLLSTAVPASGSLRFGGGDLPLVTPSAPPVEDLIRESVRTKSMVISC